MSDSIVELDDESITEEQREQQRAWGEQFLRTLDEGMKIASGETTLPSDRMTFSQKIEMWKEMANELK